jgi:general stress protein 26
MTTDALAQAVAYLRTHPDTQLATVDGDQPTVRAMWVLHVEDDGTIWYAADRDSAKIDQIARNPKVCVHAYGDGQVVSVLGTAATVDDCAKKEALWSPAMARYYAGVDDPKLILLVVTPVDVRARPM